MYNNKEWFSELSTGRPVLEMTNDQPLYVQMGVEQSEARGRLKKE